MTDSPKVIDSPQPSKQSDVQSKQSDNQSNNQPIRGIWKRLETSGDIPPARSSCAAGVIGNKLVIFSGEHVHRIPVDGHVYVLDLSNHQAKKADGDQSNHQWYCIPEQAETWPLPRVGPCSAATSDKLLLYGGRIGKDLGDQSLGDFWQLDMPKVNRIINRAKRSKDESVEQSSEQTDDETVDESADQAADRTIDDFVDDSTIWTPLPIEGTPPPPLSYASMIASKDIVYVLNGATVSHGLTNDIWYYDVTMQQWEQETFKEMFGTPQSKRPCPSKRTGAAGVHAGDGLHILFGLDGQEELADHWLWDFEARGWERYEKEPIVPPARSVSQAVFLPNIGEKGSIFVCCGERAPSDDPELSSDFHHDCWLFDVATKNWQEMEMDDNAPSARGWFNACAMQDGRSVVLFGGYDGKQRHNDVYIWSIADD